MNKKSKRKQGQNAKYEDLSSLETVQLDSMASIIGGVSSWMGGYHGPNNPLPPVPNPGHCTLGAAESEAMEQIAKDFAASAELNNMEPNLSAQQIHDDVKSAFSQNIHEGLLQNVPEDCMTAQLGKLEHMVVSQVEQETGVEQSTELLKFLVQSVDQGITNDESTYSLQNTINTSSTTVHNEIVADIDTLVNHGTTSFSNVIEAAKDMVEDSQGLTVDIVAGLVHGALNNPVKIWYEHQSGYHYEEASDYISGSHGWLHHAAEQALEADGGLSLTSGERSQEITNLVNDVEQTTHVGEVIEELNELHKYTEIDAFIP